MGNVRQARIRIAEIDFFIQVIHENINKLDPTTYYPKKVTQEFIKPKYMTFLDDVQTSLQRIESKFSLKHKLEVKYHIHQFKLTDKLNKYINLKQEPLSILRDCLVTVPSRIDSLLYRLSVIDKMLNKPFDNEVIDEMHILRYELHCLSNKIEDLKPILISTFFKEKPHTEKKEHKPRNTVLYTSQ